MLQSTWIIFGRALRQSLRNPVWIVMGLTTPLLYLVLFGPLLAPVASLPGFPVGDVWQVFVPGLLVTIAIFGSASVGFGLLNEMRSGVVERMRVTPVSRTSLLLGRALHDVVVIVVQAVLLILVAVLGFGLRAPVVGVLVGVVMVGAVGLALACLSYTAALRLQTQESFAPLVQGLALPVLLLSGVLLPLTFAPGWLLVASWVNPLSWVVEGVRAAFLGETVSAAVGIGALVALALAALSVWWGTRMFARASA